ncbi:MAG: TetR/AcrR family transcriptional regulator [Propionicimonas sp.]
MRERILATATSMFVDRGYEAVAMREIAEACGITKAALYYHFSGKADVLHAIFVAYLDDLAAVVEASGDKGTGEARLRWLVAGLFEVAPERRAVMRLAMHDVGKLDPEQRREFAAAYRSRFIGPLQQILRDGAASGEFKPVDPEVAVWLLLGMLYPFFAPPGARRPAGADAVDALLDVFLHGLAEPASG